MCSFFVERVICMCLTSYLGTPFKILYKLMALDLFVIYRYLNNCK